MLTPDDQYRIAEELTQGSWSLRAWQVRDLQGPYVYALMRDRKFLYIGVKSAGGERPFNPEHHVLGGPRPYCRNHWNEDAEIQAEDELVICPMPTPGVAQWAEKVMIERLRPSLNQRRVYDAWRQFPAEGDQDAQWKGLEFAQ